MSCDLTEASALSLGYLINTLFPATLNCNGSCERSGLFSGVQEGDGSVENAVPALSSPAGPAERVDDEVMRAYSCFGTKGSGGPTWGLI